MPGVDGTPDHEGKASLALLHPVFGGEHKGEREQSRQLRVHLAGSTQPKSTQGHLGPGGTDHHMPDV